MSNIKGKGQRLIPEELLKYLEAYKENHPDPTQGGGATLEDIVDSAGNKRFIEGDGTPITKEGVTSSYCKWSLSGTHLMCVFAGSAVIGTAFYVNNIFVTFPLPEYIANKIYPVWEDNLENKTIEFIHSGTAQNIEMYVKKDGNNIIIKNLYSQKDVSYDSTFRVQIDLLIDADYSE